MLAPHPAVRDRALFAAGTCQPLFELTLMAAELGAAANVTAYDDVNPALAPLTTTHFHYYGNGWASNLGKAKAHFAGRNVIYSPTLLVRATVPYKEFFGWEHSVSVDAEPSLFTPAELAAECKKMHDQGVMPRAYFPLSWAVQVIGELHAVGLTREQVQLHPGHWTGVPHICSGITGTAWGTVTADETQYTDRAGGVSLDASLGRPGTWGPFGTPAPRPRPKPRPKPQPQHSYRGSGVAYAQVEHGGDTATVKFELGSGGWTTNHPDGWKVHGVSAPKPDPKPQPQPKPAVKGHNPVPGAVGQFGRVDQGIDLNLSAAGYVAPYKCKILVVNRASAGWSPQGSTANQYLAFELLEGPFAGQGIYVAEGISILPNIAVGDVVAGGTKLCDPKVNAYNNAPGNIEVGWVAPNATQPLCQVLGPAGRPKSDHDEYAIACGAAMNVFHGKLGAVQAPNHSGLTPNWALLPAALRKALGV